MFGKNPKRAVVYGAGNEVFVHEIFKTIQAEGPYVGMPAIFVRLGGCNLSCSFCDTEFENFTKINVGDIIRQIQDLSISSSGNKSISLVVITGGEPMRQPISLLCQALLQLKYKVQIETNGTLYQNLPNEVDIVCSPKTTNNRYFKINEQLLPKINAFKYLISANIAGYDIVPDLGHFQFSIPVFVQAMDEYDEELNFINKQLAVKIAIENGYRLSYQIHKELEIR